MRAILLARHTMNRPRTSPPPPHLFLSPFLPACLPACPHPAPLWCTLCVSAFTVFTSIIQHLSTRFSLPVSFQSPASLSSTLPLSLTLNKKSLLIARNLRHSVPHRLTSSFFFFSYLFLSLYLYILSCVCTVFNKLRKCFSSYYRFPCKLFTHAYVRLLRVVFAGSTIKLQ